MKKTANYNLNKIDNTDEVLASITALNDNAEIVDKKLKELEDNSSSKNYKKVTYIESTGKQFIDLELMAKDFKNDDIILECKFSSTDITNAGLNGMYYYLNSTTYAMCFGLYLGKLYVGNGDKVNSSVAGEINHDYIAKLTSAGTTIYDSNGSTVLNTIKGTLTNTGDMSSIGISLFGCYQLQTAGTKHYYFTKQKLYYCKVWKNNELIHSFIPVYFNNQYCLYDEIQDEIYYNQGSGSFKGGEVVTNA